LVYLVYLVYLAYLAYLVDLVSWVFQDFRLVDLVPVIDELLFYWVFCLALYLVFLVFYLISLEVDLPLGGLAAAIDVHLLFDLGPQ